VSWSGETNAAGDNGTILFFNCSSADHFPGTGVVHIDPDGNYSAPLIIKEGFNFLDRSSGNVERVGDYTNIATRFDNPGEFWGAGVVGYGTDRHGTWVSQIFGPVVTSAEGPAAQENASLNLYPNPAQDVVNIEFESPENGIYQVELFNLQGQKVGTVAQDRLQQGKARLTFMTNDLEAGVYLIKVSTDKGSVHSEKLIVR